MKITRSLMLPTLLVSVHFCANAQDWRKIAPLISTRPEVEALLGRTEGAYSAIYQLKEGSLLLSIQVVLADRNAEADGTYRKTLLLA